MSELLQSKLLIDSLVRSPLLVDDLGGLGHFDRELFACHHPESRLLEATSLNFQQKLGHLYEDALEQVLGASDEVEDLHCSIQVFAESGRTLGEFDYLFRCRGVIIHLELAVKFYCAVDVGGEIRWYGPDARDHWERKRKRMLSHQLEIAQTKEGGDRIEALFGTRESVTKHLIYGRIFDRLDDSASGSKGGRNTAKDVSDEASRGRWLWRADLKKYFEGERLWLVPKCLWPCQLSADLLNSLESLSCDALLKLTESRAVMMTDGREFYFLMHDNWLDEAS